MARSDRIENQVVTGHTDPVDDLRALVRALRPQLHPMPVVFCALSRVVTADEINRAIAVVREAEGVTLVLPERHAGGVDMTCSAVMAQITLTVNSALDAVGLTAAVSVALADHGIACNVIAGFHHDHVFVPVDRADDALVALAELSNGTTSGATIGTGSSC